MLKTTLRTEQERVEEVHLTISGKGEGKVIGETRKKLVGKGLTTR